MKLDDVSLATAPQPDQKNPLTMWTPYAIAILFYGLIFGAASLLLSNVSKEKENRIMEVLLTSVTPRQLLTGKIVGLGIVGLGQTILWLGTTYILFTLTGRTFKLPVADPFAGFIPGVGSGLLHSRLRGLRQPDGRLGGAGAQPA